MKEVWRPIKGFDGVYEVSNLGNVHSVDRTERIKNKKYGYVYRRLNGKCIKPYPDGKGHYLLVCLSKEGIHYAKLVHRLVAEAFLDNPMQLPEVNHKDENKHNNAAENLEWCDNIYNNNYGTKAGSTRGEKNPRSKFTEEMVRSFKAEYIPRDKEYGLTPLARKYGISVTHACSIVKGRRWGWLD